MIPAPLVDRAQKFRRWYAPGTELFKSVDVIIAPATLAPRRSSGQTTFVLDGVELPVRANIGSTPSRFPSWDSGGAVGRCWSRCRWRAIIGRSLAEDIALRVALALEGAGAVFRSPAKRNFRNGVDLPEGARR